MSSDQIIEGRDIMGLTPKRIRSSAIHAFIGVADEIRSLMSSKHVVEYHNCHNGDDEGMNRWNLVDDFITAINKHRAEFVSPSHLIYVDESMSRRYGLGGDWIDISLSTYGAIDRKPENGCEINTIACGRSGIMLQLEIFKSPEEAKRRDQFENMSHGAAITRRLVDPWIQSNGIV
eukprot:IDg13485t1